MSFQSFGKKWKKESETKGVQSFPFGSISTESLDALLSLQNYKLLQDRKDPLTSEPFQYLLKQRSYRETISSKDKPRIGETDDSPEKGHKTYLLAPEIGNSSLGAFSEVKGRLAFHDLLNVEKGYAKNAEVQFLSLGLRRYLETDKWELNQFQILKITSLQPYNYITESKSYLVDLGFESITTKDNEKKESRFVATKLEGAWGITLDNHSSSSKLLPRISFLAGAKANQSVEQQNNGRLAPSANAIALWSFGDWKAQVQTVYYAFSLSENLDDYKLESTLRYAISSDFEIRVRYSKTRFFEESGLAFHFLF
jgi:hypothetical protein